MATRHDRRRLILPALGLAVLVSTVLVGGMGTSASADVFPPPGVGSLPAGQWIAFTINPTQVTTGDTVNVSVAGSSGIGPATLWGPNANWPAGWSAGGISLEQVAPCSTSESSCSFRISGSSSTPIVFGLGLTPQQVQQFQQPIVVQPPPTTTTTTPPTTTPPTTTAPGPDSTFTGPPNGQLTGPGQFTFQAKGEPGVTYQWTLTASGATINSASGPSYTPPPSIFSQPGTYTLTLTATSAGGIANTSSPVQFVVQPSNPTPPPNHPAPTPQPPAATGASGAAPIARPAAPALLTGLRAVSYVPQLPNFATPTPGAAQPVTVIWLWRPDWFQPSHDPPRTVRTGGRPSAVKRADVSINPKAKSASAAPLLAGLAAFGIFGAGWVMFKRRQVRSSLLD